MYVSRKKTGTFECCFSFPVNGRLKKFGKSLKTKDEQQARGLAAKVEEVLDAMRKGYLEPPSLDDLWPFLLSGGRTNRVSLTQTVSLGELFTLYEAGIPAEAMEANSLATYHVHRKHLLRILGGKTEAGALRPQEYVVRRSGERFRGKSIKPQTIKKEIATLRAVCNWAANPNRGHLKVAPVFAGLEFGKSEQRQPFMTMSEIEQKRQLGGDESLWECLFLDTKQVEDSLAFIKGAAKRPFIYPMCCLAAKTGARRSEMVRARLEDLDLNKGEWLVREKKKDKRVRETFRRAYLTPLLTEVLRDWLTIHPGGPMLFHVSCHDATRAFRESVKVGPWEVMSGFHLYRHSFCSNLAAKNIDQRIIDSLVGHQTEAMKKRYLHLYPANLRMAVAEVYS